MFCKYLLQIVLFCAVFVTSAITTGMVTVQGEKELLGQHEWFNYLEIEPTCERDGEVVFLCDCGEVKRVILQKAFGHKIEKAEARSATCVQNGWGTYEFCAHCEYTTYAEQAATGHNFVAVDVLQELTCEQDGVWLFVCEKCAEYQRETIKAIGHDLQFFEGKEVACESAGWQEYEACSRCDYSTKEEISALDHNWDNGKWTDIGKRFTCLNCEAFYIEGHTHVWNESENSTAATCLEDGEKIEICYCGASRVHTISALGHQWNGGEMTAEGEFCIRCYSRKLDELPSVPSVSEDFNEEETSESAETSKEECESDTPLHEHRYELADIVKEATCQEEGEKLLRCDCGLEKTAIIAKLSAHVYENKKCIYCGLLEEDVSANQSAEYSAEMDEIESDFEENSAEASCEEENSEEESFVEEYSAEGGIENSEENSGEIFSSNEEMESSEEYDGEIEWENAEGAEDLLYQLTKNGTGYICTGLKDENAWQALIPDAYNGLPVVGIADGAFNECKNLVKLQIGANVTDISESAVYGNYYLTEVYNRSAIESGDLFIYGANRFFKIHTETYESGLTKHQNGCITYFDGDKEYLLRYIGENSEVVIPDGVNVICSYAFRNCDVKKITIAASVALIEKKAFYELADLLQEVTFLQPKKWYVKNKEDAVEATYDFTEASKEYMATHLLFYAKYEWVRE